MRDDWINLGSHPVVEALLGHVLEMQDKIMQLEVEMVLLKTQINPPNNLSTLLAMPSAETQELSVRSRNDTDAPAESIPTSRPSAPSPYRVAQPSDADPFGRARAAGWHGSTGTGLGGQ